MRDIPADPCGFPVDLSAVVLLVIDMQRDFLEPGGFGASLGNDVAPLRRTIEPIARLLAAWRSRKLPVVHTREGHAADLSDLPASKRCRGNPALQIGQPGPMGRLLVRGEPGHAIIAELAPSAGETVIDKPGKGAFYATSLHDELRALGVRQLIVAGVTTEICVHSTVREANDRGYDCLVLADCTASYFPDFHDAALKMITAQGGLLGYVGRSADVLAALESDRSV